MSPEKPNAGKPMQLSEGFAIKHYPIENFLSSYASQFERNLLAETPENPSSNTSAQNYSYNPNICPIWAMPAPLCLTLALRQPQDALRQLSGPLRQTRWPLWCFVQHLAASAWHCVSPC